MATAETQIVDESLVADVAQQVAAVAEVLVEAVADPAGQVRVESGASDVVDEPDSDLFVCASRAFRAVAAEPSIFDAAREQSLPPEATTIHVAPRRSKARRKLLAVGATVGVMGVAGMLAVSMTLPAEAVAAVQGTQNQTVTSLVAGSQVVASDVAEDEIQAYVASSDVQNDTIERTESFSTASLIDLAAEKGIQYSNNLYTNDPDAAIQWPFVVGVSMSSGYGARWGRMHEGIDLVPGDGAPVQVIADGTVRTATESGGNFGVTVYVDHVIDGKVITSHYSHMQYGSLRVSAGDKVKVGDIVGLVGNTGRSYGSHLHFELIVNGSTIDPLPWLQENAGRYDY
ncbi:M23 family metallopeptidase [Microbacterium sp. A94]|uniref:M23 family metallopeptidase n=1 Tax=Microbacterium sp. A94 TaxID=3450717 RepID=UPI003F42CF36